MNSATALASILSLGYTVLYVLMCVVFPFGTCRTCRGTGKHRAPIFHSMFRECRRCHGTGRRVRLGRRLFEYLHREYRTGTRVDRTQLRSRDQR